MRTDKRVQNNYASTAAVREIMLLITRHPEQFCEDESLQKALKSQGGIAKLEYEATVGQKVVQKSPMSLNTLKHYADELFDEGFEGLNNLRLKAREAIQTHIHRARRPDSRSRTGLQFKVKELEEELEKQRSANFILLQAINSAMGSIKGVRDASDADIRGKRAKDGLDRIRAIASLNPHPFDEVPQSNVVSLTDFKNDE